MKRTVAAGAAVVVAGAVALAAPAGPAAAAAPRAAPALLAAAAADRLIAGDPDALHLSPYDSVEQRSVVAAGGLENVAYERTHRGLRVLGGDFVVVTDRAGTVLSTWVAQRAELALATTRAAVPAARAVRVARARLGTVRRVAAPALVVVADGAGRLAYELEIEGVDRAGDPARLHVVVDARTGRVIEDRTWNEVVHATGHGGYYGKQDLGALSAGRLVDPTRPGLQCGGQNGSPFTSSTDSYGSGGGADLPSGCADAMYSAQQEWNMLREWTGRNGFTGTGRGFPARVGLNQANAFWNGSYTSYGRSSDGKRQMTNMDIVGHEYGHAIFANTPGSGGGGGEVGAMSESAGDILGNVTEFYANHPGDKPDYEVGELTNFFGSGPIRYMYDPAKRGDPNCMWTGGPPEVHKGAGVQNHWFYLLAEGSNPTNGQPTSPTCNSSTVTGIGVQKAAKIFVATLSRKTSGWSHARARAASVAAARELFPGGVECRTTRAAWDAVSVRGSDSC
ncbi:hypothetical protein GCM10010123_06570 [Pilimelia anulata]|uniref:Neutral metalloproteinase n=1 Tax=Pilimelia anulata TaxID=53371 RepID=A0A8J3B785_9ACTN|nr:M4 family metallopeptidase [Pilimelia anulata]GGJ79293.1 hypothetical protein GCM10010123_06570 [Pilimelia anulata]